MALPKVDEEKKLRSDFFQYLFGDKIGWICIASESVVKGDFSQKYFAWPHEESSLLRYVNNQKSNKNVWFCVNLLGKKSRKKEDRPFLEHNLLWADLDDCPPDIIDPRPQLVIESSPDRYQAIWLVDEDLPPEVAEDYSRRIYGQYKDNGVDSGWALGKLLRVPYTENFKYPDTPKVKLLRAIDTKIPSDLFDELSYVTGTNQDAAEDANVPELQPADPIITKYAHELKKREFVPQWGYEPTEDDDWSKLLWRLINTLLESGLSREEAFSVAHVASVNKYARDNRPLRYLWRDICKAANVQTKFDVILTTANARMPELVPGERYKLGASFIERYVNWGKEATDASSQYHELAAFMALSSLLSGNIKLETSFGIIRPNLWGLILGDSTLTRKTTAMRMAIDAIEFIDRDILLATDGSAEGILTGLSGRPGRTSLFFRDEVVGLFDAIRKKDYLAGIPQLFTQLYDGSPVHRLLRKELIAVDNPIFMFFGGGIKEQFLMAVDDTFVYSGFLPRFLIVSAETEREKLRRIGPPTPEITEKRQQIYLKMHELYHTYMQVGDIEILGQPAEGPIDTIAYMTPEAYQLYGDIEERMVEAAFASPNRGLTLPTFERLSRSLLKMALLVAATRQEPDDYKIEVIDKDILRAAKYVQKWGEYTIEILSNVGQTVAMRTIDRVHRYILDNPGVARSQIMRSLNLTKRQMTEIEDTLEARGHVRSTPVARGRVFHPVA